jgi:formate hydrogenlyase subunit 3/multisubunit Na+/H+ antiporter MnhD subunit
VRPTRIIAIVAAVLVGLGVFGLAVYLLFVNRPGHRLWFYWIAPLLALGFAGMMINLVVGYWRKVGRLEMRGRRVE